MRIITDHLETATFLSRPNRFTVACTVRGSPAKAYLPNPGRLWELLVPGADLLVVRNRQPATMHYTVMAVVKEGIPILLHTHLTNTVVEKLLKSRLVPGLEDAEVTKREVAFGHSRYDFLLQKADRRMILEVKNCTLFGQTLAMFPDAVTARGSRHLTGLLELAEQGEETGVLFVVQWPYTDYFMPEYHTDLDFSTTLLKVRGRIMVKAVALKWSEDLSLDIHVKELTIPWHFIERRVQDRGCYVVILHLPQDMSFSVGELGDIFFRKGYYVYVGSAKRGLTQRMARHAGKRKKLFWHIDYLRQQATFSKGLAIRTPLDLECRIANSLKEIADWSVTGFGASDCSCDTHLFGMEEDPVLSPSFVRMLCWYRIGIVEEELRGSGQ